MDGHVPFPRDSDIAKLWVHVNEDRPRLPDNVEHRTLLQDVIERGMTSPLISMRSSQIWGVCKMLVDGRRRAAHGCGQRRQGRVRGVLPPPRRPGGRVPA